MADPKRALKTARPVFGKKLPSNRLVPHPREILDPPLICVKISETSGNLSFQKLIYNAKTDIGKTAVTETKTERQELKKNEISRQREDFEPNKSD